MYQQNETTNPLTINIMKSQLTINNIVKETEKAILVSTNVSWNGNSEKEKQFWMPKKVVEMTESNTEIMVEDWFLNKLEDENTFKGYRMSFWGRN